jgi:hypothetical protein
MKTTENTLIEAVSEGLLEQYHESKRHKVLITSNKNPSKKRLQNVPTKNPRKGFENHKKGKKGGTQSSLEEPR